VIAQYDAYRLRGGFPVDGRLTAGENIADIGGLRLAHAAFRGQVPRPSSSAAGDDGLTSEQRFFVAFGQTWCTKRNESYARLMLTVDTHAPPQFRVNGAVSDLPAFQEAFSCRAGAPMAPARRCDVW
jgi:predicted metalloendopeptidase